MNVLCRIWKSSLGKKYLMAISGAGLALFAIGHMVGNLQIFLGPEALNRYAHFLQSNKELLWPTRLGLLALLIVHVASAITLTLENQRARPVDYSHGQPPYGADLASRMMLVGGLVVGAFIIYHLLHYTVKAEGVNMGAGDFHALKEILRDGSSRPDVFAMVVAGFNQKLIALFYFIGVGLLCYHLSHGIAAMFQSLGLKNRAFGPILDKAAKAIAIVLFLGYVCAPGAILLGYGKDHLKKSAEPAALKEVQNLKAKE